MPQNTTIAERRAALLHAGAQVSRRVISILDPEKLLQQVVDIICDEFGFYYAGVFLLDEVREWAVLRAGRGAAGAQMVAAGHKLKVGGLSMIGVATGQRRALIALDVGEEPVHFKNPYLPLTRSEMALPLSVGDQVIGALTVQSTEEAAFTEDDITALQAMADQLAIAIHNARLHAQNRQLLAQAERRARLLAAAAQVGRDVTSILDWHALINETVDIICEAYGFYYAGVFLLDEMGEWAVLRAGRGEAGARMLMAGHKLKVGGISMIGTAISQRRALIALDVGEEPVHFKNPYLPLTRSEMALPLMVGDRVIGALTVQSVEEAAFSEEDIASLQAMADQLAIALDNARLLRDLEAAHAELLRTKTFEALATATLEAIHWIGNKALPVSSGVARLRTDLAALASADPARVASMQEDLTMIEESVRLILAVQEHLIGPAREQQPRPVLVEDVVKDTVARLGLPAGLVRYTVAANTPLAIADSTQLGRACGYILQNAVEALVGAPRQEIRVEIAPTNEGRFVDLRIIDTGPGIPEAELDKLWAAFHSTKGATHAGLGLSACVQILRQIDGQITARNVPGGGALFEMLIPAFSGEPPMTTLPHGRSILLVDDDDAWSRWAVTTLSAAGNQVARTTEAVEPAAYDLILVDDALETADSTALVKQLTAAGAGGKLIVVASYLRVERTTSLLQRGVRDVVLKPYTPAALAGLLG